MGSHVSKGTQLEHDRTHPAGLSPPLVSPLLAKVTTLWAAPCISYVLPIFLCKYRSYPPPAGQLHQAQRQMNMQVPKAEKGRVL